MELTFIIVITTVVVILISALIEYFFSLWQIITKRPLSPKGAVEIDPVEHIYSHPDYVKGLQDSHTFDVRTIYEVLQRGLRISGDQPQFSYRYSSDQKFKSYTYK